MQSTGLRPDCGTSVAGRLWDGLSASTDGTERGLPSVASAISAPAAVSAMHAAKADWNPSVRASAWSPPAASTSVVREIATVETTATPSAAPIWKVVLLSPEASPAWCSGTPARAAIETVTNVSPTPGPQSSRPRKTSPK